MGDQWQEQQERERQEKEWLEGERRAREQQEQERLERERKEAIERGEHVEVREGETPEQFAITVGSTIVATTTIDAIMTSIFPTRSADLTGTPVYTWIANGPPVLAASWPAATTQSGPCTQLLARFEVHSVLPSTAGP